MPFLFNVPPPTEAKNKRNDWRRAESAKTMDEFNARYKRFWKNGKLVATEKMQRFKCKRRFFTILYQNTKKKI